MAEAKHDMAMTPSGGRTFPHMLAILPYGSSHRDTGNVSNPPMAADGSSLHPQGLSDPPDKPRSPSPHPRAITPTFDDDDDDYDSDSEYKLCSTYETEHFRSLAGDRTFSQPRYVEPYSFIKTNMMFQAFPEKISQPRTSEFTTSFSTFVSAGASTESQNDASMIISFKEPTDGDDTGQESIKINLAEDLNAKNRDGLLGEMEHDGVASEGDDDDAEDDELSHRQICRTCDGESIEAKVLEHTGYDLARAAILVPLLHTIECSNSSSLDGGWASQNTSQCTSDTGQQNTGVSGHNDSTGNDAGQGSSSRKRSSCGKGPGEAPDEQGGSDRHSRDPKRSRPNSDTTSVEKVHFACPFNKWKPGKYNCGRTEFRTCHGPGFTEFRLLKIHLEKIHTHVQCERCGTVVSGTQQDRTKLLGEELHRLGKCPMTPPDVREGISNHQWSEIKSLKSRNTSAKDLSLAKSKTDTEKWNETWTILFPSVALPDHPWCDVFYVGKSCSTSATEACRAFVECYIFSLSRTLSGETSRSLPDGVHTNEATCQFFRDESLKAFDLYRIRNTTEILEPDHPNTVSDVSLSAEPPNDVLCTTALDRLDGTPRFKPAQDYRPPNPRIMSSPASNSSLQYTVGAQPSHEYNESARGRASSSPSVFSPSQHPIRERLDYELPQYLDASYNLNIGHTLLDTQDNNSYQNAFKDGSAESSSLYRYGQHGASHINPPPPIMNDNSLYQHANFGVHQIPSNVSTLLSQASLDDPYGAQTTTNKFAHNSSTQHHQAALAGYTNLQHNEPTGPSSLHRNGQFKAQRSLPSYMMSDMQSLPVQQTSESSQNCNGFIYNDHLDTQWSHTQNQNPE